MQNSQYPVYDLYQGFGQPTCSLNCRSWMYICVLLIWFQTCGQFHQCYYTKKTPLGWELRCSCLKPEKKIMRWYLRNKSNNDSNRSEQTRKFFKQVLIIWNRYKTFNSFMLSIWVYGVVAIGNKVSEKFLLTQRRDIHCCSDPKKIITIKIITVVPQHSDSKRFYNCKFVRNKAF